MKMWRKRTQHECPTLSLNSVLCIQFSSLKLARFSIFPAFLISTIVIWASNSKNAKILAMWSTCSIWNHVYVAFHLKTLWIWKISEYPWHLWSKSITQFVGISRVIHSWRAIDYSCWSVIVTASDKLDIYWIPPRYNLRQCDYLFKIAAYFLGSQLNTPISSRSYRCWNLWRHVSTRNQFIIQPTHFSSKVTVRLYCSWCYWISYLIFCTNQQDLFSFCCGIKWWIAEASDKRQVRSESDWGYQHPSAL